MTQGTRPAGIGRLTRSDVPANPAYHRVRSDYVNFHVVFVVIGGLFTLLLLLSCVFFWLRFRRAPQVDGRKWTFERRTYFSFGVLSLVIGLFMAVAFAANLSTVVSPGPGLAWAIKTFRTPQPARAFTEWMQSGSAHIPPLIQNEIDERLAWQRPKAIICSILLVTFVALSVRLWRALITKTRSDGSKRSSLLLASGSVSVLACFLLMLMVLGNTEAAFAPLTITLLYG
jgi:hypothetical protein